MHDGMPYGRIQGQGQGHEPLKVWIPSIFKTYLLRNDLYCVEWDVKPQCAIPYLPTARRGVKDITTGACVAAGLHRIIVI